MIAHDTTENKSSSNKTHLAITLEFSIRLATLKVFSGTISCTANPNQTGSSTSDPINCLFSINYRPPNIIKLPIIVKPACESQKAPHEFIVKAQNKRCVTKAA